MMKIMIPAKRLLLLTVAGLLLLTGMALSIPAQEAPKGYHPDPKATPIPKATPRATPDLTPMWAVNGKIRWKKAMGVVPVNSNVQNAIDNRCISFYVAASDPGTGAPLRGDHSQMWKGADEGEYYVCHYTLSLPQNRQVRVFAGMGGEGLLPQPDPNPIFKGQWVGGNPSQSRPPQGTLRGFTGTKYVKLSSSAPRASADFELIYITPRSDDPK